MKPGLKIPWDTKVLCTYITGNTSLSLIDAVTLKIIEATSRSVKLSSGRVMSI